MLPSHFLPIKVVLPRKEFDFRPDPSRGGSSETFCEVTPGFRKKLVGSVQKTKTHFSEAFKSHPSLPAVAKVELHPDASAKSHRPTGILNDETCPIIGGDKPCELLVSVSRLGLDRLEREIATASGKKEQAQISTLLNMLPFRMEDALDGEDPEKLAAVARKNPIRLRLFQHPSEAVNKEIKKVAKEIVSQTNKNAMVVDMDYGEGLCVLAVKGVNTLAVERLAGFAGTQSLSVFPELRMVRRASYTVGPIDDKRFPPPRPGEEFGLVGMVDTGTDPFNDRLQEFVVKREDWVARGDQNNEHGSFVGGIIANGHALNHRNQRFPTARSKIIDIAALDKHGTISEYDLITVVERAVKKYPKVRVWNLSLGQDEPCKDGRFSLLAAKLDSIAKRRSVLFVIAAGNHGKLPLRGWPPDDRGESDRICPPADCVRGLTVGSMAHLANNAAHVDIDFPSPFSRRGPAPHFYIKPEISHYGGNCDKDGDCLQNGVVSISGSGQLAENLGTSFAAPSISTLAANMFRELESDTDVSPTMIKAMLVHSAFVRSGRPTANEVRYRGFGSPGDLFDVLNCTRSSATVIFLAELEERVWYDKYDFPMPACLNVPRKGLHAEVFMTLAYDPPTDARYGVEYCRSNVTASLGTIDRDPATGEEKFTPQLKTAPKECTKGYEERLVKEGYKWSPLKLYHRPFEAGPVGKQWRLHMQTLYRSGFHPKGPQPVILLVTIRDPKNKAPVYDAMVREMERLAWGPTNLQIASRVRARDES